MSRCNDIGLGVVLKLYCRLTHSMLVNWQSVEVAVSGDEDDGSMFECAGDGWRGHAGV